MPNTTTSFTTFVAGTKAKASEINNTLANMRGDRIPINSDTVSASDLTHNLGTDEHRWLGAYVGHVDYETSTTTAGVITRANTSQTAGSWRVDINSTTVFEVGPLGFISTHFHSQTFTSSGTWTCPSNVTKVYVLGVGGGGGGGGGGDVGQQGGGEGGGGSWPQFLATTVTPLTEYTITVGSGGTAGNPGSGSPGVAGGTGTSSAFGSLLTFAGANGGAGGSASTASSNSLGFDTTRRTATIFTDGGQAFTGTNSTSGSDTVFASGGAKGSSSVGGAGIGGGGGAGYGAGGAGGSSKVAGSSGGIGAGGGGGGGCNTVTGGNPGAGATGGAGLITVYWEV